MITRVTEDELAFGGYGMYVTGVHTPAISDDIRYISALITMEIVHAVERYVNDNTALQRNVAGTLGFDYIWNVLICNLTGTVWFNVYSLLKFNNDPVVHLTYAI